MNKALNHPAKWHILVVFAVIAFNKLGFDLSGGEEQYLAFAKQAWNPEWIPGSFTYSEFPGSRIVFQWLVGPLMQVLSFETATFIFRLWNFAFLAIPIGLILRRLNVSLLCSFAFIQLFTMSSQNLVGGEWIIKSFEPKSVAYGFVFFGLYEVLRERKFRVAIYLALATYFHVLVGGWIMLIIGLSMMFQRQFMEAIKMGLLYVLILTPFIWYLFSGYFSAPVVSQYNLDSIYCYFRLPHHLGIWKTTEYFMKTNFYDSLVVLATLITSIWWVPRIPKDIRPLAYVLIGAFAINLVFVGVAAMDHFVFDNSGGFGLKYYPFRSNAIGMFILVLMLSSVALNWMVERIRHPMIERVLLLAVLVLFVSQAFNNVERNLNYTERIEEIRPLTDFVNAHTSKESVFLILEPNTDHRNYISFGRLAQRENFMVTKFVSAERSKLDEWYRRARVHRGLKKNPSRIIDSGLKNGFTHVITERTLTDLTLLSEVAGYRVYALPLE